MSGRGKISAVPPELPRFGKQNKALLSDIRVAAPDGLHITRRAPKGKAKPKDLLCSQPRQSSL